MISRATDEFGERKAWTEVKVWMVTEVMERA